MTEAGALLAAIAGVVAAGCGLVLVVRNARAKGRRAAIDEADAAEAEIEALRSERIADRRRIYVLQQVLTDAGVELPP